MEFNMKDLEMLIDKVYHEKPTPSMSMYCPQSVIDWIKEHFDYDGPVEVKIHYKMLDDGTIWVIPEEEKEEFVKIVIPEEEGTLRESLEFESEE